MCIRDSIGTDLWFAAVTKTAGSAAHHQAGHVHWRITALLLAGGIAASLATIALMHFTGITKGWASALTFSLGIALLLTAVVVAYKQAWHAVGLRLERWLPESRKPAPVQLSIPTIPTGSSGFIRKQPRHLLTVDAWASKFLMKRRGNG